jgi:hypothetical protein
MIRMTPIKRWSSADITRHLAVLAARIAIAVRSAISKVEMF